MTATTDWFSKPSAAGAMFMFSTPPWPTVVTNLAGSKENMKHPISRKYSRNRMKIRSAAISYPSKIREALLWPTHGHPVVLPAHAHGCQNQYVGTASLLPSGPSCIVIPCISVGWKNAPDSLKFPHGEASDELGAGPLFVYRLPVEMQTSPRYGEISVAGDVSRTSSKHES